MNKIDALVEKICDESPMNMYRQVGITSRNKMLIMIENISFPVIYSSLNNTIVIRKFVYRSQTSVLEYIDSILDNLYAHLSSVHGMEM